MSRILVVLDHKENRRLLVDYLQQQHEIIVADSAAGLTGSFDCVVIDGVSLERFSTEIRNLRLASEPNFLPVLLITSQSSAALSSHQLWQIVDELVHTPIEKIELQARIAILLRARKLSVELAQANGQLQQQIVERQQAERALEESLATTTELYDIGRRMMEQRTPDGILHALLLSTKLQSVHYAAIHTFTYDNEAKSAPQRQTIATVKTASNGADVDVVGMDLVLQSYMVDGRLRESPLWIEDVAHDSRLDEQSRQQLLRQETRCLTGFQLEAGTKWNGQIELHSKIPNAWTAGDLVYIQHLLDRAAVMLDNIQLLQSEIQARQQAELADKQKLEFLAMISHELRTPLASIKGFATTLMADDVNFEADQQRYFLTIIDEESNKLNKLVGQLLDLSRIQAGILSIALSVHNVTEVLADASPQLQILTTDHQFTMDVPDELPLIMVDVERLSVVITNLVGNAVKYSEPHSRIALRAYEEQVQRLIVFEITDEGVGIPLEERSRVFEAFRQLAKPSKNQPRGAGLGLAICKGLVEAHGGAIWIQDQATPGTTVAFSIPIYAPKELLSQ
ncbi:MAG: ATP-binding protein [Anaerolineae bacterium]